MVRGSSSLGYRINLSARMELRAPADIERENSRRDPGRRRRLKERPPPPSGRWVTPAGSPGSRRWSESTTGMIIAESVEGMPPYRVVVRLRSVVEATNVQLAYGVLRGATRASTARAAEEVFELDYELDWEVTASGGQWVGESGRTRGLLLMQDPWRLLTNEGAPAFFGGVRVRTR